MPIPSNLRVLYIAYWGAAEPLGKSLVLPAVKRLAALGVNLTLVSFEKPDDLDRVDEIKHIGQALSGHGIDWIPLRYHKQPRILATSFDLLHGLVRGVAQGLRSRPDIIHARTFAAGLMGMVLARILGARLIYHNEGFYPDEQVDAGVWREGEIQHRLAKDLEDEMYKRADAVITLSHRAKMNVERIPAVARRNTPVIVVPSCVDLDHFVANQSSARALESPLRFVYSGSVGGRYSLDKIGRFVAIAAGAFPQVNLKVLTRSDPELVSSMLDRSGLPRRAWSVASALYESMPAELASEHIGMHFLTQGLSDHGGSPTKIGEYWATGLPAIVTRNAGDTSEIICNERVGVVVNEHTDAEYHRSLRELRLLLDDHGLAQRCRRAAEIHYGPDPSCLRQVRLYHDLMSEDREQALVSPVRAKVRAGSTKAREPRL